jgi:Na+/melibiose symporter-like transporter
MMMVVMAVMRLMVMAVMVMMRRVRERDVREKNQCKREADKFTHELDPLTLMNGYTPG